jgi:hypothetical protein
MKNCLSISIACILAFSAPGVATAQTFTVQGTANIFSAGLTTPVAPGGSGAGILPVLITLSPSQSVFQFSASGSVTENNLYGFYHGPDGRPLNGCETYAYGGISGFITDQVAPLAGIFLTDAVPGSTPPPTLDFRSTGLGLNFTTLAPAIGQVFFIGNGQTSGGIIQTFYAPAGATRLFLGIPDAVNAQSYPGGYGDNAGSFSVTVTAVPEPAFAALGTMGAALYFVFRRRVS